MNSLEAAEIVAPNGKTDDCAKFTIENPNTTFTFKDICTVGQDYVFGCYAKSDGVNSIIIGDTTYPASQAWSRIVDKFNATSVDFVITFSAPGTYYLYNSKLEIGNVDTDWSPAPEDIFQKTAEIEITVDGITSTVTDLEGNVSKVEQTAESLVSTVTDLEGNLTSLELSVEGLTSTVSDVEGNMSQLQQTVGGLQSTVTDIEGNYSQLTQTVNGLNSTVTDLNGKYSSITQTVNGFEVKINQASNASVNYILNGTPVSGGSYLTGWTYVTGAYQRTFPGGEDHKDIGFQSTLRSWCKDTSFQISLEARCISGSFSSSDHFVLGLNASWEHIKISGLTTTWKTFSTIVTATATNGARSIFTSSYVTSSGAKVVQIRNISMINVTAAYSEAKNAAKTATNYLSFSSSGLVVGNHTGTLQGNVLLNSSGMQVRNGSTIYATYGVNLIELGRNNTTSTIKLCNGSASIYGASNTASLNSPKRLIVGGSQGTDLGLGMSRTDIYGNSVRAYCGGAFRTLKPIYRLYNPYDKCYLETADANEANSLVSQGWKQHSANVFYAFK